MKFRMAESSVRNGCRLLTDSSMTAASGGGRECENAQKPESQVSTTTWGDNILPPRNDFISEGSFYINSWLILIFCRSSGLKTFSKYCFKQPENSRSAKLMFHGFLSALSSPNVFKFCSEVSVFKVSK